MKRIQFFRFAFVALVAAMTLASCDDDAGEYYNVNIANALVTLKTTESGAFYMQLDDSTTLRAVNVNKHPYGDKEVRALVNCYKVTDNSTATGVPEGSIPVKVFWIDSIRTKAAVPYPAEKVDELYGNDPVELVKDWVTVAEDGYLTLRFRTQWGGNGTVHYVNLLTGGNSSDPYEVEFRHDAKGDKSGHWGDALVAFKLPTVSGADGSKVTLTLKYTSYSGEKTVKFSYKSGKVVLEGNETERAAYTARVK